MKKKNIKIRKRDVGTWCTLHYDDIGNVTGLIVEAETDNIYIKVYIPAIRRCDNVGREQIIALGNYLTVPGDAV